MTIDFHSLPDEAIQLFSPPELLEKINDVLDDPRKSFNDMAEIISQDVGLTARLLKIVNSSYFSLDEKIETISHAISMVGTEQIRDLAFGTLIIQKFSAVSNDVVPVSAFWEHCIATGIAARTLAILKHESNPEPMYIAGILHEIGRLVVFCNFSKETDRLMELYRMSGQQLYRMEEHLLGNHHGEVGAQVLENWKFPETLIEAVKYHHAPSQAPQHKTMAAIVHMGDIIAHCLQLGKSGEVHIPAIDTNAWKLLDLPLNCIQTVFERVENQYKESVHFLL
ncbi:MAG: HDOD domain-containing protein [Candidatus Nitrohelix vancouverensis]|uniref:HDOD domain-containing protein n=1 Tax=Candidatus Nitrohelix vancouverensis TaxID=2705534 RepID=A0A7T0C185_9BACT|nr:MAG: HDOD domain-containing protein [Candidatus Nitrohelix vancouverensis]